MTGLLRSCGLYTSRSLTGDEVEMALRPVGTGEWMLLKKEPFLSIDPDRYWFARMCRSKSERERLVSAGFVDSGPGKWKIVDIRINKGGIECGLYCKFSGVARR